MITRLLHNFIAHYRNVLLNSLSHSAAIENLLIHHPLKIPIRLNYNDKKRGTDSGRRFHVKVEMGSGGLTDGQPAGIFLIPNYGERGQRTTPSLDSRFTLPFVMLEWRKWTHQLGVSRSPARDRQKGYIYLLFFREKKLVCID